METINMDAITDELEKEIYELKSNNSPFNLPLRISRFEDGKDYIKFVTCCEKLIRTSIEYKEWKNYIIDDLAVDQCLITNERINECTIEIHHHLPNLMTVVKAIVNKNLVNNKIFCSFDIATKCIEIHFENKIGYITLLKSMHEKFHNGFLTIPINLIMGDYNSFLLEYSEFLDDDDLETINNRKSIVHSNCNWSRNIY